MTANTPIAARIITTLLQPGILHEALCNELCLDMTEEDRGRYMEALLELREGLAAKAAHDAGGVPAWPKDKD